MPSFENLNHLVGLGTLLFQIASCILLAALVFRKKSLALNRIVQLAGSNALWIALLVNAGGLVGSLYYSEILGIAPCGLCWIQRAFMYPQVVLFAIALYKKDFGIATYSIALSIIGGIVAFYQHYLQTGGEQLLPCPASSVQGVDCARRIIFEFGYITFPLVAFSIFAFLIVLMICAKKSR